MYTSNKYTSIHLHVIFTRNYLFHFDIYGRTGLLLYALFPKKRNTYMKTTIPNERGTFTLKCHQYCILTSN